MATGDVRKLGGFYLAGTLRPRPTRPWQNNTTPPGASADGDILTFSAGRTIEIRNTPSADADKLQWVEVNDAGKTYLVSDRVLLVEVSWEDLNAQGLITGKQITIDGQNYILRVLRGGANYRSGADKNSGGTLPNEWDRWICNEAGLSGLPTLTATDLDSSRVAADLTSVHNQKWNWYFAESWCQETYTDNSAYRVLRGGTSARYWIFYPPSYRAAYYGWRPVLEVLNQSPTVTVTMPTANQTLYENETLNIAGTARDEDANQSVTVYYQINSETRRVLATDVSQKNIALSKQLTFKGGKLYDGDTAVTGTLTEGVAHKLKVWAVDDQGGTSTIVERAFYAVPNRAPSLTVNTPSIVGNIDTDKIQLSGTYSDPDGNACTVSYKINGGNSVQVASGVSGNWSFEITFGQLKEGPNNIIIENIDSYGAKTSKTVKLNKTAIETPLLKSVARYQLTPPLNEATGVLLYVQRSEDLAIDVKVSMTLDGEPENFVPMSLENTAPVPNEVGIVEDELYYIASESKQKIIVQIEMERSSVDVSDKIIVIEGAFY